MGRHKKELPMQMTSDSVDILELPITGTISIVFNRELTGGEDVVSVNMASIVGGVRSKITEFNIPHKQVIEFSKKLIEFAENSSLSKPAMPAIIDSETEDIKLLERRE